jgi:ABC-type transport system substrate-binding protein
MHHLKFMAKSFAFLALSLALFSTSCTKKDDEKNLQVYHAAEVDDIKTWDPAAAYDEISLEYVPVVFETLFQYVYLADTYKLEPLMAADMPKYSADRLTVTIRIKPDIHFQDDPCFTQTQGKGRLVKAQDFIYEFKRLALPVVGARGFWIFDGKIVGINAFQKKYSEATTKEDRAKVFEEPIEGIKALDDSTIQIKLTKPYPQLLYVLAMNFTSPVASEAVAAYADERGEMTDHAVGTGPFYLKSWERNKQVVLERNPTYHPDFYPTDGSAEIRKKGLLADAGKTLPFLDRIVMTVIHEVQPRWLNFMKGQIDKVKLYKDNFPQAIEKQVNLTPEMTAKGLHLDIMGGVEFYYVSFNTTDPTLGKNKYLRQALASAIDRDRWIETFTGGTGRKQVTALPPGVEGRPENSKIKYDFDLPRAKELLKKAGYPDGNGLPVLNFDLRGADSLNRQIGEFFTQQFAAIGVHINVIANTFPAFLEKLKNGNLQISYGGWTLDYPDAENVYQLLYGPNKAPGPNESGFDNPEMNRLYEQLAQLEPGPKRSELIKKADDILQEEVPWALGYYQSNYYLTQPWLQNYRGSMMIENHDKYLRVDRDLKKRYLEGR